MELQDFFESWSTVGWHSSPIFIIVLDYVLRTSIRDNEHLGIIISKSHSKRTPPVYLTDTDFADDIALISDNITDA